MVGASQLQGRKFSGIGLRAHVLSPRVSPEDKRRGAVVLETLIVLPILLIAVLGIVQFSIMTSRLSWVKRASRDGADCATAVSPLPLAGAVPPQVIDAVSAVLSEKNMTWTEIRLEHNVGPGGPYVLTAGGGPCPAPTMVPSQPYVMVTVCVEQSELAPNLLETMCFDLEGRFVQQSTIRCY